MNSKLAWGKDYRTNPGKCTFVDTNKYPMPSFAEGQAQGVLPVDIYSGEITVANPVNSMTV